MNFFEKIENKIIKPDQIDRLLSYWRFNGDTIVFTNGCFDIVHYGHINYLSKAADLGSKLIIGLNSDNSVKRLKGKNRPINGEMERAILLASLIFIDGIIIFDEDTPFGLISNIKPDILVKGGDYQIEDIVGYDIVQKAGGIVQTIDFVDGYSSSKIIQEGGL
ncbi:MAG: D-glycero-beta-D-manno-heptose 1-phosphate adenylyltransferase [Salinivirgaceae bacterium]|nr:D-glycero-beta-D-manno-heptose 1-phosphate adenylyltransferase [Salinivirgaceae bacterium]